MSAPSAAATPAERAAPDWDLSAFFPAVGDARYREFRDALEADADTFEAALRALPPLTEASLAPWRDALVRLEELASRASHLGSYLGCVSAADARDEDARREVARLARLRAALARA